MFELGWLEKRLRSISRRLTHFELQNPEPADEELTASELEKYLFERSRMPRRFLGFYSKRGLSSAFNRYGTFDSLRERGFDPKLSIHQIGSDRHMLRVSDGEGGSLLIELVSRFASLKVRELSNGLPATGIWELVAIEWLLLQNPGASFDEKRPRLPGQLHPGLGIGREIMTLLQIMAERLEREGLLVFPEHYHNGLLFGRSFWFFSPEREGEMKALERDLSRLSLSEASWAVEEGLVIDERTGSPYEWHGEEMILPLSKRLSDYFESKKYTSETDRVTKERRFHFDPEQVEQMIKRVQAEKPL